MNARDRLELMRYRYAGGPLPTKIRRARRRSAIVGGCAIFAARLFWWLLLFGALAVALRWALR